MAKKRKKLIIMADVEQFLSTNGTLRKILNIFGTFAR